MALRNNFRDSNIRGDSRRVCMHNWGLRGAVIGALMCACAIGFA